jgi:hypothetical protein
MPTRPTLARVSASLLAAANSPMTAGGAITTSNAGLLSMRFFSSGAVLKVIFTVWPFCFSNAATAALSPGSMAPALSTAISAARAGRPPAKMKEASKGLGKKQGCVSSKLLDKKGQGQLSAAGN